MALSGASCTGASKHCLAVNDEKKYAQFFDIIAQHIAPAEVIRLLPDEIDGVEMNELDAEGVAYVGPTANGKPAYFYVIGSHGLSRQGTSQPSRFTLLRFPVDPSTGRPTFGFGDGDAAPEITRTSRLRDSLKSLAEIGVYAEQRLDHNGLTIEGLAIKQDEALLGLRSPCISANAFVIRVPLDELFKETAPTARPNKLELGDNVGVRDLVKVGDGLLILAGRSDDARGDTQLSCGEPRSPPLPLPSVWFWSGKDGDPARLLGTLPGVDAAASAETLMVLEERETTYRTLVLFDGVENGGPIEFIVDK